ncbi:hypothetical protein MPH_07220 [Macrophomina phaseolina MS6]|uniref:Uncharacterized protein n=1 Tax=Macrophomina phaseolina (strain MS6) TaxID=1126212 RepID=K2RZG0_MACPH|nr:hypothetical protein MPH_07220 [Macrophomina phaseolina MS6]
MEEESPKIRAEGLVWWGVRFIYGSFRLAERENMKWMMEDAIDLKQAYPDLICDLPRRRNAYTNHLLQPLRCYSPLHQAHRPRLLSCTPPAPHSALCRPWNCHRIMPHLQRGPRPHHCRHQEPPAARPARPRRAVHAQLGRSRVLERGHAEPRLVSGVGW